MAPIGCLRVAHGVSVWLCVRGAPVKRLWAVDGQVMGSPWDVRTASFVGVRWAAVGCLWVACEPLVGRPRDVGGLVTDGPCCPWGVLVAFMARSRIAHGVSLARPWGATARGFGRWVSVGRM